MIDSGATNNSLTLSTTRDRVELARRTHRSVVTVFAIVFAVLALVILGAGLFLLPEERRSAIGVIAVTVVFVLVPIAAWLWIRRIERRAELFLSGDGVTLLRVDAAGLTIGDTLIPLEQITCLFANTEQEHYSVGAGARGEVMAYRLNLTEDRPTIGRAIGARIGTGERRRLYSEGAKSGIMLVIGVDKKSELPAPATMIQKVPSVPQKGDDPGRIVMPFGAYLTLADLEVFLTTVHRATGGGAFPIGVVNGTLNWASAQVMPADTRAAIQSESTRLLTATI